MNALFSRKSNLETCQVYLNLSSSLAQHRQEYKNYSTCENKPKMQNEVISFKILFWKNKIWICLVKNESGTHILTNSQIRFSQKQGLKWKNFILYLQLIFIPRVIFCRNDLSLSIWDWINSYICIFTKFSNLDFSKIYIFSISFLLWAIEPFSL